MKNKYFVTKHTVSFIRYHFVFCPRYRRKIFSISGVEERFKKITEDICAKNGIELLDMACNSDSVHIFLACTPMWSPHDVMKIIKRASTIVLREEFPALSSISSLWTRSFFVSTAENISDAEIQRYVDTQKKRS